MTYDQAAALVQIWGLLFFVALFCLVLAYVFLPANRARFAKAARAPLDEASDLADLPVTSVEDHAP